jgi:tetratricopeptide (TPR) repeat protein
MVDKALALDPQLPYAWVMLSRLQSNWEWDWPGAEASVLRAQQLEPNNTDVLYALTELRASRGQLREAIAICQRIIALDPMDQRAYHDQGRLHIALGELDAAEDCYRNLLSINPHHRNAHGFLGKIYMAKGDGTRALEVISKLEQPFWRQWGALLVNYSLLRTPESKQEMAQFIADNKHDAAVQIAQVYAGAGEVEEALHWLEIAYEQRDAGLAQSLLIDDLFISLRGHPGMEAVAKKIGLLDDYRAMLARG